jgi:hypothetical protein
MLVQPPAIQVAPEGYNFINRWLKSGNISLNSKIEVFAIHSFRDGVFQFSQILPTQDNCHLQVLSEG